MKFRNKEDFKKRWSKSLMEVFGLDLNPVLINFTSELAWAIFNTK